MNHLIQRARAGDPGVLDQLFAEHRDSLLRFAQIRLDERWARRVSASDIVQESFLEASQRLNEFFDQSSIPFRLWLFMTCRQQLLRHQRQHDVAECRSVRRELRLPQDSSVALAQQFLARSKSPSSALALEETADMVRQAIQGLEEPDQEIIVLRFYEQLDHKEIGVVLGISSAAARKRQSRAMLRLHSRLVASGLMEAG